NVPSTCGRVQTRHRFYGAIIQWLPHIWPKASAQIVAPTYGEYAQVFSRAERAVEPVPSLDATAGGGHIVVVGNPNNPDGRVWSSGDVQRCVDLGNVIVIDEAFADVAPDRSLVGLSAQKNVVVLKSFGKFFGLAGVRLGFAVGHPEVIAKIEKMLGPWAVSGAALHLGVLAMRDERWIARNREWANSEALVLRSRLESAGFVMIGQTDLFVTAAHPQAAHIAKHLAEHRILARTFDYAQTWLRFGLPGSEAAFTRLDRALLSAST
ncbi:MAG: aminotransferase class I/II-fold pyridoxal phosphate-dependent enzyme, partial [Pseudomonadota bacterium]